MRDLLAGSGGKPRVSVITRAGRTVPCEVHAAGVNDLGARIWHARPVDRDLRRSEAVSIVTDVDRDLRRSEAASIVTDPAAPPPGGAESDGVVLVQFACDHPHDSTAPNPDV